MRHSLLPACIAAFCLAIPTQGVAEEASDCGVICRLEGYLSSDHMTGGVTAAPASAAGLKPHRATAHKPAATASKPHTSPPSPASGKGLQPPPVTAEAGKTAPKADSAGTGTDKARLAKTSPARAVVAPPTAMTRKIAAGEGEDALAQPSPAAKTASRPTARIDIAAHATPKPVRAAKAVQPKPAVMARAAKTAPAVQSPWSRTLTAYVLIPGSAPTMPAGFQPFQAATAR